MVEVTVLLIETMNNEVDVAWRYHETSVLNALKALMNFAVKCIMYINFITMRTYTQTSNIRRK